MFGFRPAAARIVRGSFPGAFAAFVHVAAAAPLLAQGPPPAGPSSAPPPSVQVPASGPPAAAAAPDSAGGSGVALPASGKGTGAAPTSSGPAIEDQPAFAGPPAQTREGGAAARGPAPDPSGLSMAFWSAAVLLLLGGFLALLRRWSGARPQAPGETIRLIARRGLDARHQVWLIEVGRKIFLIGTTKDGFARLGELSGAEEVAPVRAKTATSEAESSTRAFDTALKSSLREYERKTPEEGALDDATEAVRDEIEGLRKRIGGWRIA